MAALGNARGGLRGSRHRCSEWIPCTDSEQQCRPSTVPVRRVSDELLAYSLMAEMLGFFGADVAAGITGIREKR